MVCRANLEVPGIFFPKYMQNISVTSAWCLSRALANFAALFKCQQCPLFSN